MKTLALDIGGANLKAAHDGGCASMPFAMWRDPGSLSEKIRALGIAFDRLLVTMTGELCDCFASRNEGVRFIVEQLRAFAEVRVWSMERGFVSLEEASAKPQAAASGNWHALATWVSRAYPARRGVLIDVGSTTTDVIPYGEGPIAAATDYERLRDGRLVYVGARRTTLAALGPIQWQGKSLGVMAEHFATTADVYVLLGHLDEDESDCETADGRPLTKPCAAARVLRMIGADLGMMTMDDAVAVAKAFDTRVRAAATPTFEAERVVVSGSGGFLVEDLATDRLGGEIATAACAYALWVLGTGR